MLEKHRVDLFGPRTPSKVNTNHTIGLVKAYLAIIRRMDNYSSMCNSMLKTFPAQQIIDEILKHLATVDSKDKDLLDLTLDPVIQLCNRYKAGTRGYVKRSVVDLINRYLRVEAMFQV